MKEYSIIFAFYLAYLLGALTNRFYIKHKVKQRIKEIAYVIERHRLDADKADDEQADKLHNFASVGESFIDELKHLFKIK